MKKLTFIAAIALVVLFSIGAFSEGKVRGYEAAKAELSKEICWGDVLMENYVLDVVDETDFWDVCDSTAFNAYVPYTSEWYLAVCCEFSRIYK